MRDPQHHSLQNPPQLSCWPLLFLGIFQPKAVHSQGTNGWVFLSKVTPLTGKFCFQTLSPVQPSLKLSLSNSFCSQVSDLFHCLKAKPAQCFPYISLYLCYPSIKLLLCADPNFLEE